jgi:hypothetical protein
MNMQATQDIRGLENHKNDVVIVEKAEQNRLVLVFTG